MNFQTDRIFYGGDYNPDQWLDRPDILKKDIELMQKAGINSVSLGIFAWARLEPEEGRYDFDWLEEIMKNLYAAGISTILATPSGARPHWLADRYPEVLRTDQNRVKRIFGTRHNHCYTSPVYRDKVRAMNRALAERFDANPAVTLWHISNEYGGECHCPLCQEAFRGWLRRRYKTIEAVNLAWNTWFWSHQYDSFEQIESPSSIGEDSINGLKLDWKRFVSDSTVDFCRAEIEALRSAGARKPVTTNLMYEFTGLNYYDLAQTIDVVSWDNYPAWGKRDDAKVAMDNGMQHDFMRSLKNQPFLLMESCPGATNWQPVSKLKRPGVLQAASLQAVAHGADAVQYFQIRKGRGGSEKFHGAVIDHYGGEDDRVYQECKHLGQVLKELAPLTGSRTSAQVAVICDVENRWAMEGAEGPRNSGLHYMDAVKKSYWAFRKQGLNVDVITEQQELNAYKIVAAPMLYLFRPEFAGKVRAYVEAGGCFILTYWSGVVDEHDSCFLGGTPGGLMEVMGLRSTEIDGLYDWDYNEFGAPDSENVYRCEHLCQLVRTTSAKTLMTYRKDFYQGTPALTENSFGAGKAYYICADAEQKFYDDFYRRLTKEREIAGPLVAEPDSINERKELTEIPYGIEVCTREKEDEKYLFLQNFTPDLIRWNPQLIQMTKVFGEYEKIKPDGRVEFLASEEEKGFMPYETRIYRSK